MGGHSSNFTYLVCRGVVHQADTVDSFQEAEKKKPAVLRMFSDDFLLGCGVMHGTVTHTGTGGTEGQRLREVPIFFPAHVPVQIA